MGLHLKRPRMMTFGSETVAVEYAGVRTVLVSDGGGTGGKAAGNLLYEAVLFCQRSDE